MTTEWMDKPDGDGWFDVTSCYTKGAAIVVRGDSCQYIKINGDACLGSTQYRITELMQEGKKFRRINLPEPPPYVAPKPPKVEIYTAKCEGNSPRFITKIVDQYVATNHDGVVTNWGSWDYAKTSYTDIKPIEAS